MYSKIKFGSFSDEEMADKRAKWLWPLYEGIKKCSNYRVHGIQPSSGSEFQGKNQFLKQARSAKILPTKFPKLAFQTKPANFTHFG